MENQENEPSLSSHADAPAQPHHRPCVYFPNRDPARVQHPRALHPLSVGGARFVHCITFGARQSDSPNCQDFLPIPGGLIIVKVAQRPVTIGRYRVWDSEMVHNTMGIDSCQHIILHAGTRIEARLHCPRSASSPPNSTRLHLSGM